MYLMRNSLPICFAPYSILIKGWSGVEQKKTLSLLQWSSLEQLGAVEQQPRNYYALSLSGNLTMPSSTNR